MTASERRILVAEDTTPIRQILEVIFRRSGYTVYTAPDGEIADQMMRESSYDLLVTDFMMPKLTGIQLIKAMRDRNDSTPVLLISGTVPASSLQAAKRFGAVVVMEKPFRNQDLVEKAQALLTFQQGANDERGA